MNHDRLTLLQVSGFKSLSDVNIPLDGLMVLIGENGTGKSAILEDLTIFASAAERVAHVQDVIEKRFGTRTEPSNKQRSRNPVQGRAF